MRMNAIRFAYTKVFFIHLACITYVLIARVGHAEVGPSGKAVFTEKIVSAEQKEPWQHSLRATSLSYLNTMSTLTLRRDAELTYNPYYAMTLALSPHYWFDEIFYLSGFVAMTGELTEADNTTYSHEIQFHDSVLKGGASNFWTIPHAKIDLSFSLSSVFPTSKQSRAKTMILGLRPELTLSRRFDLLGGLGLSYQLGATKFFNQYTTAQRETPIVPHCLAGTGQCDAFLNTGVRNTDWRLANSFAMSLDITEWIGLSVSGGIIIDWLYEIEKSEDEPISWQAQESTDKRHTMVFGAEVYGRPLLPLVVALGVSTVNPQLTPDSEYETPFFNRYTAVYLDLRLDFESLVDAFSPKKENKI